MSTDGNPVTHLLRELRRRHVFRTAALYVVGTWLILQVADVVFPALGLSELSIRYLLIAAAIGFPAVLVFGWFYDVGADGIRRTGSDDQGASQSLRRSDYVILAALVGVVGVIVYGTVDRVAESPAQTYYEVREGPPMVAVLPFVSQALTGESDFFASGVHDDLLTQLAKLQSVRVISRTSVMEFKDTVLNIREIGRMLGADAILEGGVQSAGNRIRINAQLIDARTDEHLWANTYDRELTALNIFEVQSEIARAITAAMHGALTEQDATQLEVIPTENMAAYRAYHRAMELRDSGVSLYSDTRYREALQEAVALDANFTRAWAELVGNLSFMNFFFEQDPEFTIQAEAGLERIREIAPDSADHLMAKAYFTYYILRDFDRAFEFISMARALMPSDTRLLELAIWIQRRQGDFEGRLETIRLAKRLDPRDSQWDAVEVNTLSMLHRYDEMAELLEGEDHYVDWIGYWRSALDLRQHGDWDRWVADQYVLAEEFPSEYGAWQMWELHILARNFAAAEDLLPDIRGREDNSEPGIMAQEAATMMTYWFQGRNDELQDQIVQIRSILDLQADVFTGAINEFVMLDGVTLEALSGNPEEAKRHARRWSTSPDIDWTNRSTSRAYVCQALAMGGAAAAAVECIREGLVEPSTIVPFIEPHLPYYDAIRESPEFIALLAEIYASMH